jgi:hypothetical protein
MGWFGLDRKKAGLILMEESWFRFDRKRLIWFGWKRAGLVWIARDRFGLDGRELVWFG